MAWRVGGQRDDAAEVRHQAQGGGLTPRINVEPGRIRKKDTKNAGITHDVYENKGRSKIVPGITHDVYENKDSYRFEPTMLLKTHVVSQIVESSEIPVLKPAQSSVCSAPRIRFEPRML
jgi:hypothetical protein